VGTGTLDGAPAGDETAAREGAEAEEQVRIDFSSLESRGRDEREVEKELSAELAKVAADLEGMSPNMKALQQYDEVSARLHSIEGEWDEARSNMRSTTQRFLTVQAQRHERFMSAFDHISKVLDDIYKDLTQVEGVPLGGTAYLTLEDLQEPYLHGIKYTAMPPAKRWRDMEQLSGGERTVAALALLFAIHEYRPSPFFVMDEIDAALDNVNVTRVAKYIRERADEGSPQFVVISLKDNFYDKAHGLVGIFRDRQQKCSRTVTLDLEKLGGSGGEAMGDDRADDAEGDEGDEGEEGEEGEEDEEDEGEEEDDELGLD